MKIALIFVAVAVCQVLAAPSVDNSILKTLETKPTATVIVSLTDNNVARVRNQFLARSFATRAEKLNTHYELLKKNADQAQANILAVLNKAKADKPIEIDQLWITNQIVVRNADRAVVEQLLAMDEVAAVREERIFPLEEPIDQIIHPDGYVPKAGEQWGVLMVKAPEAWANGNEGQGAVIGTTDTGVRYTHVALAAGHRSDYGWYDPTYKTAEPNDQNGHGTHTAGTIAGRANGIGVAPKTQWIACKGCQSGSCSEADLLGCGQWHACPTDTQGRNPDCSKAANAVSNSWGGGQEDDWYDDIIASWRAMDIAPLFSIGNSGPYCSSANSPGDSVDAIGVGSTTSTNGLSSFSSVGPTYRQARLKPEIAAPGSSVVSSYYLSDTAYSTLSGTSMACPHVAGLAALLYTQNPNLTYTQVRAALLRGAQPTVSSNRNCGSISEGTYPNHHVGQGRVSAPESLRIAASF